MSEQAQTTASAEEAPSRAERLCVLAIDDEASVLSALTRVMRPRAIDLVPFTDPRDALRHLERAPAAVDVVLCDIAMGEMSGFDVLRKIVLAQPDLPVVMMTADTRADTAVEALKIGAYDYLLKPFDEPDALAHALTRAVSHSRLVRRTRELERQVDVAQRFEQLVGRSPRMRVVFDTADRVAATDVTVLIRGESGTGKELVARAIHARSSRRQRPFVAINCAALPEGLLDSELFGHVRGAFSGAIGERRGVFEEANRGTLFLDEVGDLPAATQVRLLRALQEREIRPVGGNAARPVDVRVIAATHVNLEQAVGEKKFREDLFYRLNVVSLELPPLRARADDIPILAAHFLRKHAERQRRGAPMLTPDAARQLSAYTWPGNVRELENAIERALALTPGDRLNVDALPERVRTLSGNLSSSSEQQPSAADEHDRPDSDANAEAAAPAPKSAAATSEEALLDLPYAEARTAAQKQFEQRYLARLLALADGNLSEAARRAGLDRSNFRRALGRHGLLPRSGR